MKKTLSLVLTMCIVLSLFATFVISASAEEAVNLAAGKTYTYPTDNLYFITWSEEWGVSKNAAAALTDGDKSGNYYGANTMVGWSGIDPVIVVDLGVLASVDTFKYTAYAGVDGIAEATAVTIEVSTDNTNWTEVTYTSAQGEKVMSDLSWAAKGYIVETTATAAEAVDAQYVRFTYTRTGSFVFLNEIEVWGTVAEATVETKVLNLDRANHYDWTNTDYNSTQYTPTAASAGEILLAASTDATADVGGRFGGNYFTWWYVILAEWDATANAYVVTEIDLPGDDDGKPYETWTLGEGKLVVLCNTGYSSTEVAGNADDAAVIKEIVVGDKFTINGSDFDTLAATSGALEGVSLTINAPAEEGGTVVITKGDNIALNKTYTISGCGERSTYYAKLTDGVAKTEVSYNHDEWFGFYCNGTDASIINAPDKLGYVVIDLGASYDIHSVSVNFVDLAGDSGIFAPTAVNAYLSADGETWSDAVALTIPAETTKGVSYAVEGEVSGNARYVKVDVALGGTFAFLNEIEVYEAKKTVTGGSTPEVIVETITVDGDLTDTGWAKDGWVTVTPDNGYWQSLPTGDDTVSYKYQLRADETKLYAAFVVDCAAVEGGNGVGTNVRFWINSDSEATVYTHFYDVYLKDGAVAVNAKYNTAKDANSGANIESSTIDAVMTTVDGKTYVEFSVDLAEFNGAEGFNYFVCVSNKANEDAQNVCLYYPAVAEGESRTANLPYAKWYTEGQATVDVEAIQLGEVVVNGGTDDNLGDAGIYAIAALAVVALIGTAIVIKKRA